jgi:putative tricarboxylic transport membrane protein
MDFTILNLGIMLFGILQGLIAGLLPGIGNVVVLMLVYPFITDFSLFQIILFYMCLAGAAQYTGSVVATTLAVPGETSSLPAVTEGHRMFLSGRGNYAISNSAIGSFFGAAIASGMMLLLLPVGVYAISNFYNTHVQSIILIGVALFLIMTYADQKWYHNLLLFAMGWFLSSIGFSKELMQYNYEYLIDYKKFYYLHFGLPLYPVVVALFVFPIFLKEWNSPRPDFTVLDKLWDNKFVQHLREFGRNIGSSIRGTVIGSLCGLVPHMTSTLASNVAYIREMSRSKKRGIYNENGDIKCLVSAETANNAAGLTQLTPLLLIGIPITTSEAIVLNIIENNMEVVNWKTTVESGMFGTLAIYFVVMNALCLLAAWPFAKHLHVLFKVNQKILYTCTFMLLMCLVFYMGTIVQQQMYYIIVTIALLPLGYLLRRWDTLILIFAFVLQGQIQGALIRLFHMYSDWLPHMPYL